MKRLLLLSLFCVAAGGDVRNLTSAVLGVNGESVSGAPYTDAIDMWDQVSTNQITMTWTVTPGSTTVVTMGCSQAPSDTATAYAPIPLCDTASPSVCVPDVRSFTLASFTASGSTYALTADWPVTEKWVKCYISGTGTGTAVATGTRSWQ